MQRHEIEEDDLDVLNHLEEIFYARGYEDGQAHGKIHGSIEGRDLGRRKGFEVWEELGYYEAQARMWKSWLTAEDAKTKRVQATIDALLQTLEQIPMTNTPEGPGGDADLEALMKAARTRYRLFCSSAGIRPRIQVGAMTI